MIGALQLGTAGRIEQQHRGILEIGSSLLQLLAAGPDNQCRSVLVGAGDFQGWASTSGDVDFDSGKILNMMWERPALYPVVQNRCAADLDALVLPALPRYHSAHQSGQGLFDLGRGGVEAGDRLIAGFQRPELGAPHPTQQVSHQTEANAVVLEELAHRQEGQGTCPEVRHGEREFVSTLVPGVMVVGQVVRESTAVEDSAGAKEALECFGTRRFIERVEVGDLTAKQGFVQLSVVMLLESVIAGTSLVLETKESEQW